MDDEMGGRGSGDGGQDTKEVEAIEAFIKGMSDTPSSTKYDEPKIDRFIIRLGKTLILSIRNEYSSNHSVFVRTDSPLLILCT